ncbi:transglutaminase-like domain-containing protein [Streptomyces sp. HUAS ZL42]|uniref:transglutaminase-like domain-containing protein n=1 Tax=Streptomyces sp. HUAS ZL42 TaxID=3231715 RepID=UPI00345EC6D5
MEDFYLKQTPYSDPGDLATSTLPRDPGELAGLVRDLIIHRGEGGRFGCTVPVQRLHEDAESRYVTGILRILRERGNGKPLTERRAPKERFVGTCRDFALLHCSLLRATGTAARIRCGFATYFDEDFHADHWVTEYRLPDGRWTLTDPQVHHEYDVPFDPMDVPRERFLVAAEAWRACRAGRADPRAFGVRDLNGIQGLSYVGLWFVRAGVGRDLAALNGVELLPWDTWGPEIMNDASLGEDDLALVDAVAAAGSEEELRRLYEDPRLTVPQVITSYTTYGGVRKVTLREPSAPRA